LYMAQRLPLPLTVPCVSKIQIGFTFLVPAHLGSAGHRAVKRVYVCMLLSRRSWSVQVTRGRPGGRFHVGSGGRPTDSSTWRSMAWCAGMLSGEVSERIVFCRQFLHQITSLFFGGGLFSSSSSSQDCIVYVHCTVSFVYLSRSSSSISHDHHFLHLLYYAHKLDVQRLAELAYAAVRSEQASLSVWTLASNSPHPESSCGLDATRQ